MKPQRYHNNLTSFETNNTFRTPLAFDAPRAMSKVKCTYCGCWKQRGLTPCSLCGTQGKPITNLSAVAKKENEKIRAAMMKTNKSSQQQEQNTPASSNEDQDLSFGECQQQNQQNQQQPKLQDDNINNHFFCDAQQLMNQQEDFINAFLAPAPVSSSSTSNSISPQAKNLNVVVAPSKKKKFNSNNTSSCVSSTTTSMKFSSSCATRTSNKSSLFKIESIVDTYTDPLLREAAKFRSSTTKSVCSSSTSFERSGVPVQQKLKSKCQSCGCWKLKSLKKCDVCGY